MDHIKVWKVPLWIRHVTVFCFLNEVQVLFLERLYVMELVFKIVCFQKSFHIFVFSKVSYSKLNFYDCLTINISKSTCYNSIHFQHKRTMNIPQILIFYLQYSAIWSGCKDIGIWKLEFMAIFSVGHGLRRGMNFPS